MEIFSSRVSFKGTLDTDGSSVTRNDGAKINFSAPPTIAASVPFSSSSETISFREAITSDASEIPSSEEDRRKQYAQNHCSGR